MAVSSSKSKCLPGTVERFRDPIASLIEIKIAQTAEQSRYLLCFADFNKLYIQEKPGTADLASIDAWTVTA